MSCIHTYIMYVHVPCNFISRLRSAFSESRNCVPILRLHNTFAQSRDCANVLRNLGTFDLTAMWSTASDWKGTCIYMCTCSAQFRNLCNLKIAQRILGIPKLCANLEIAQTILRLRNSFAQSRDCSNVLCNLQTFDLSHVVDS